MRPSRQIKDPTSAALLRLELRAAVNEDNGDSVRPPSDNSHTRPGHISAPVCGALVNVEVFDGCFSVDKERVVFRVEDSVVDVFAGKGNDRIVIVP